MDLICRAGASAAFTAHWMRLTMSGSRVFTVCSKLSFVRRPHLSRKTIEPMETEENTLGVTSDRWSHDKPDQQRSCLDPSAEKRLPLASAVMRRTGLLMSRQIAAGAFNRCHGAEQVTSMSAVWLF